MTKTGTHMWLGWVMVVLAGWAAAQDSDHKPDRKWVAPPEAAAKQNPLADNSEASAAGRKLFLRKCAECHNEDGSGLEDAPNLQLPAVQKQSDGALFWKITNGNVKRNMPSFARLTESERWQIVSFLRTLKPEPSSSGENRPLTRKGR